MSTFNGLPAHPLLVHFMVVLPPALALLLITCAVWPAARERFVVTLLPLSLVILALTPLTTSAGESLAEVFPPELIAEHKELGETMIYFSAALVLVSALVTGVHVLGKQRKLNAAIPTAVAIITIVVGIAVCYQTYRIGDSGSRAVWGGMTLSLDSAATGH
ncbi:DUF2231 domain-containing protein [Lolliginicoccus levis]|uniref:DUF2231 domain-containing protein n=1 Tax=Lolliginicoccus levis TaxID=2919542 RepID=UPI00241EE4DE|nr:DUF2231 domain-containing protein [Lolliginicoccus levis]